MTKKNSRRPIWLSLNRFSTYRPLVWVLCLMFPSGPLTQTRAHTFLLSKVVTASAVPAQEGATARALELGKPIEGELKGGESHAFQVTLMTDQYLSVVVEQRGINLIVALLAPDRKKLLETDIERSKQGREVLTAIAEASGNYRIEISAAEKDAVTGHYEVKVAEVRSPTTEERTLEDARRWSEESRILRQKGKYDEALPLAERALAAREKVLGLENATVAESLHALAVIYDHKSDYAKAEPINVRALAIREKTLGPDHPDVAKTLNNLAWIYGVRHEYAKAEGFYQRALSIQEKALGLDHPEVATTLNDLALLYYEKGDYEQAILVNQRVLAIREKALGPDDPGVAKALNNLALVFEKKGDYTHAEEVYQRALSIWVNALGPDHPDVAFAVDNLAKIYFYKGDYVQAEPLFQRALAMRQKALGPDHANVATSLNNLASFYTRKGDYAKSEPLYLQSIAIWEKRLGPDNASLGPPLNNLATMYEGMGNFEAAEKIFQRVLAMREKALGANHADVGGSLNNLGQVYLKIKNDDPRAEALFQRSLEILGNALGPDHSLLAVPMNNLGAIYERKRDYERAEQFYKQALAIREKALGPNHTEVANSLESLAQLYQRKGDIQQALKVLFRSSEIRERNLNLNLPLGSERQKIGYLKLFAQDTDRALSLHIQSAPRDIQALRLAFTTLLRRKGRALDATTDNIAILRSHADAQDQALLVRLADARSHLATLTLRGPGKTPAASYRSQLDQIGNAVDKLEADISARSAEFRAQVRPITIEAVQALIPEGTALVEFALYHPGDSTIVTQAQPRYAAYLLTSRGQPQWVDLGEAAGIDRTVDAWRKSLRNPLSPDGRALARALDEKIMHPVRSLLGRSEHLLISSDGPLNLIPFAALVDEHSSYLVNRYTITYLTSGRDLLRLQVPRGSSSSPVVLADPAFGEPATVAMSAAPGSKSAQNGIETGGRIQVDYSQIFFGPLPGVTTEVRALKELLPEATFLTRDRATKAALRNVNGPSILHIATHGFFLEDTETISANRRGKAKGEGDTRLGRWTVQVENPLLRSGLALAGANQSNSSADDGILTALEAAGLDLWGTKIVVLSACDTGVGQVKNGDGVYGLRRALVLAGSESQMMSLWPVSDRSTGDLIVGYYKGLMQGQGRGEALRQAQLQMLRTKGHRHPFYWASFIQSGEWANLEGRR